MYTREVGTTIIIEKNIMVGYKMNIWGGRQVRIFVRNNQSTKVAKKYGEKRDMGKGGLGKTSNHNNKAHAKR